MKLEIKLKIKFDLKTKVFYEKLSIDQKLEFFLQFKFGRISNVVPEIIMVLTAITEIIGTDAPCRVIVISARITRVIRTFQLPG